MSSVQETLLFRVKVEQTGLTASQINQLTSSLTKLSAVKPNSGNLGAGLGGFVTQLNKTTQAVSKFESAMKKSGSNVNQSISNMASSSSKLGQIPSKFKAVITQIEKMAPQIKTVAGSIEQIGKAFNTINTQGITRVMESIQLLKKEIDLTIGSAQRLSTILGTSASGAGAAAGAYTNAGKAARNSARGQENLAQSVSKSIGLHRSGIKETDTLTEAMKKQRGSLRDSVYEMSTYISRGAGMFISTIGLRQAMEESSGMADALAEAHARVATATEHLSNLEKSGTASAAEITRAHTELDKALRAEAITQRNAGFAASDALYFMSLMGVEIVGIAIPAVIKLMDVQAKMAAQGSSMTEALSAKFSGLFGSMRSGVPSIEGVSAGFSKTSATGATLEKSLKGMTKNVKDFTVGMSETELETLRASKGIQVLPRTLDEVDNSMAKVTRSGMGFNAINKEMESTSRSAMRGVQGLSTELGKDATRGFNAGMTKAVESVDGVSKAVPKAAGVIGRLTPVLSRVALAIPVIGEVIAVVTTAMDLYSENTLGVRDATEKWSNTTADTFEILKPFGEYVQGLAGKIGLTGESAVQVEGHFKKAGAGFAAMGTLWHNTIVNLQSSTDTMQQNIGNAFQKTSQSVQKTQGDWINFRNNVDAAWNQLATRLQQGDIEGALDVIGGAFSTLVPVVHTAFGDVGSIITEGWNSWIQTAKLWQRETNSAVSSTMDWLGQTFAELGRVANERLGKPLGEIIDNMVKRWQAGVGMIQSFIDTNIVKPFNEWTGKVVAGGKLIYDKVIEGWVNLTTWVDTNIIKPLGNWPTLIKAGGTLIYNKIIEGWKGLEAWVSQYIVTPIGNFAAAIPAGGAFIYNKVIEGWADLTGWVSTNIVAPIGNFAAGIPAGGALIYNKVIEGFGDLGQWVKDFITDPITKGLDALTGGGFSKMLEGVNKTLAGGGGQQSQAQGAPAVTAPNGQEAAGPPAPLTGKALDSDKLLHPEKYNQSSGPSNSTPKTNLTGYTNPLTGQTSLSGQFGGYMGASGSFYDQSSNLTQTDPNWGKPTIPPQQRPLQAPNSQLDNTFKDGAEQLGSRGYVEGVDPVPVVPKSQYQTDRDNTLAKYRPQIQQSKDVGGLAGQYMEKATEGIDDPQKKQEMEDQSILDLAGYYKELAGSEQLSADGLVALNSLWKEQQTNLSTTTAAVGAHTVALGDAQYQGSLVAQGAMEQADVENQLNEALLKTDGTIKTYSGQLKDVGFLSSLMATGSQEASMEMLDLESNVYKSIGSNMAYTDALKGTHLQTMATRQGMEDQKKSLIDTQLETANTVGRFTELRSELGAGTVQQANFASGLAGTVLEISQQEAALSTTNGKIFAYNDALASGKLQNISFTEGIQDQKMALIDTQASTANTVGQLVELKTQLADGSIQQANFNKGVAEGALYFRQQQAELSTMGGTILAYNANIEEGNAQNIAFGQGAQEMTRQIQDAEINVAKTSGSLSVLKSMVQAGVPQWAAYNQAIFDAKTANEQLQITLASTLGTVETQIATFNEGNTKLTEQAIAYEKAKGSVVSWATELRASGAAYQGTMVGLASLNKGFGIEVPRNIAFTEESLKQFIAVSSGSTVAIRALASEAYKGGMEFAKSLGESMNEGGKSVSKGIKDIEKQLGIDLPKGVEGSLRDAAIGDKMATQLQDATNIAMVAFTDPTITNDAIKTLSENMKDALDEQLSKLPPEVQAKVKPITDSIYEMLDNPPKAGDASGGAVWVANMLTQITNLKNASDPAAQKLSDIAAIDMSKVSGGFTSLHDYLEKTNQSAPKALKSLQEIGAVDGSVTIDQFKQMVKHAEALATVDMSNLPKQFSSINDYIAKTGQSSEQALPKLKEMGVVPMDTTTKGLDDIRAGEIDVGTAGDTASSSLTGVSSATDDILRATTGANPEVAKFAATMGTLSSITDQISLNMESLMIERFLTAFTTINSMVKPHFEIIKKSFDAGIATLAYPIADLVNAWPIAYASISGEAVTGKFFVDLSAAFVTGIATLATPLLQLIQGFQLTYTTIAGETVTGTFFTTLAASFVTGIATLAAPLLTLIQGFQLTFTTISGESVTGVFFASLNASFVTGIATLATPLLQLIQGFQLTYTTIAGEAVTGVFFTNLATSFVTGMATLAAPLLTLIEAFMLTYTTISGEAVTGTFFTNLATSFTTGMATLATPLLQLIEAFQLTYNTILGITVTFLTTLTSSIGSYIKLLDPIIGLIPVYVTTHYNTANSNATGVLNEMIKIAAASFKMIGDSALQVAVGVTTNYNRAGSNATGVLNEMIRIGAASFLAIGNSAIGVAVGVTTNYNRAGSNATGVLNQMIVIAQKSFIAIGASSKIAADAIIKNIYAAANASLSYIAQLQSKSTSAFQAMASNATKVAAAIAKIGDSAKDAQSAVEDLKKAVESLPDIKRTITYTIKTVGSAPSGAGKSKAAQTGIQNAIYMAGGGEAVSGQRLVVGETADEEITRTSLRTGKSTTFTAKHMKTISNLGAAEPEMVNVVPLEGYYSKRYNERTSRGASLSVSNNSNSLVTRMATGGSATSAGTAGYIKRGGWGADKNPRTWTVDRMNDNPNWWKVVDDEGRNVATNFVSNQAAQAYINKALGIESSVGSGTDNSYEPGVVLHGGWGASRNPADWRVTAMRDNPNLFKVVDRTGDNVATDFTSQAAAQAYIGSGARWGGHTEGKVLHGGWGGNQNPDSWRVVRMKDNPKRWKIVDGKGINIVTDFKSKEAAQEYIDKRRAANHPNHPGGTSNPPPTSTIISGLPERDDRIPLQDAVNSLIDSRRDPLYLERIYGQVNNSGPLGGGGSSSGTNQDGIPPESMILMNEIVQRILRGMFGKLNMQFTGEIDRRSLWKINNTQLNDALSRY